MSSQASLHSWVHSQSVWHLSSWLQAKWSEQASQAQAQGPSTAGSAQSLHHSLGGGSQPLLEPLEVELVPLDVVEVPLDVVAPPVPDEPVVDPPVPLVEVLPAPLPLLGSPPPWGPTTSMLEPQASSNTAHRNKPPLLNLPMTE